MRGRRCWGRASRGGWRAAGRRLRPHLPGRRRGGFTGLGGQRSELGGSIGIVPSVSFEIDRRAPGSLAILVKLTEGLNVPLEALAAGVADPAEDEELSAPLKAPGRTKMPAGTPENAPKKPRGRTRKRS